MEEKTTCNRENGSTSDLWGRQCWVADSFASLVANFADNRAERMAAAFGAESDPDHPLWKLIADINYYAEDLRVKNGLRHPAVLNRDEKWPETI